MKVRRKILQGTNLFLGRVYIPREVYRIQRPIVMHISDTPEEIYPYLYEVVKRLKPEYLIHTGDLVDNIKLEIVSELEGKYHEALEGFIKSMDSLNIQNTYYVSGNHDQTEKIKNLGKNAVVLEEGLITLEHRDFYLNHFFVEDRPRAHYYLYGHSFDPTSHQENQEIRLNGLEAIHVISLKEGRVESIPYPLGTNGFRKMDRNYRGL